MNKRLLLLTSLVLNFLLFGYTVYSKKDGIANRVNALVSEPAELNPSISIKQQLNAMNKVPAVYIDTTNSKPGKPFRLLVIGNSLALHGVANKIGWDHKAGMAATSIQKDYAHLLYTKIKNLLSGKRLNMRVANISDFERGFAAYDLSLIDSLVNYRPDVVVFQLGENVFFDSVATPSLFQGKYIALINKLKMGKPLIVCTTPFFPSAEKNAAIKEVATSTGSYLVDLSHLALDSLNLAKHEVNYSGNRDQWKDAGIGIHPGDYGMRNIADQIFIPINASITSQKK